MGVVFISQGCRCPVPTVLGPVFPQPLGPAPRASSPVPTAAASLGAGSVMGIMTVPTAQTRWAERDLKEGGGLGRISAEPQGPDQAAGSRTHRKTAPPAVIWTSSSVRVATASPCAGAVTRMLTAWTAVTRKPVAPGVSPSSLASLPLPPRPLCGQVHLVFYFLRTLFLPQTFVEHLLRAGHCPALLGM